ncbi:unnamed protein product [Schistosoma curassoni]|uniref:Uncharacterized protein n=1 Tax=Schistosoma curassoni TaxID=6186 RepID=A0A183JIC3_9TREM|nr:unnamed protein product [Schistosoma curassoni]
MITLGCIIEVKANEAILRIRMSSLKPHQFFRLLTAFDRFTPKIR